MICPMCWKEIKKGQNRTTVVINKDKPQFAHEDCCGVFQTEQAEPSDTNALLCDFSRHYTMDGDIMRCAECGRGIIFSKMHELFTHKAGCSLAMKTDGHPWQWLKSVLGT